MNDKPVTDGLTKQLFGTVLTPDKPAPTLAYEALGVGVIVQHKGIRVIEYKKDGRDRKTKLHMFASKGGLGPWFSIFGSANLDSQLRKARAGSIMLLRYLGKETVDGSDPSNPQEQHMWELAETSATAAQIAQLRSRDEWRDRELAVDAAITAAQKAELERRANRQAHSDQGDEPPPPDDDDRPY